MKTWTKVGYTVTIRGLNALRVNVYYRAMASGDRIRFFETTKGKKGIAYNGYEYRFAKFVDEGVHKYWRALRRTVVEALRHFTQGYQYY